MPAWNRTHYTTMGASAQPPGSDALGYVAWRRATVDRIIAAIRRGDDPDGYGYEGDEGYRAPMGTIGERWIARRGIAIADSRVTS